MCDGNSEYLCRTFMSYIKEASIEDFKKAIEMHEMRAFAGSKYCVNKNLPPDTKLDSKDIVSAILTPGGWHCEVAQCGATFNETFAIDVHLQAHGAIALTKWYCGDSSCYAGFEKIFNDGASFNSHVATEHMGSSYSIAAVHRVPKQEVLVTSLLERLKFIRVPIKPSNHQDNYMKASTTFAVNDMLEGTEPEQIQHGLHDAVEQEQRAWAKFARLFQADEDPESDEDPGFLERSYGRYVFLSKAPKSMPTSVAPPNYLVDTLTGLTQMHEKDAKKFIKSYCKLCSLLKTNDVSVLRRSLGLPLQDVSMRDELRNADQEAHDLQAAQWHGDDESQDNDQCSEYV
jgi:hypothetical protein